MPVLYDLLKDALKALKARIGDKAKLRQTFYLIRNLRETTANWLRLQARDRRHDWRGRNTVSPSLDGHRRNEPLAPKAKDDLNLPSGFGDMSVNRVLCGKPPSDPEIRLSDDRKTDVVRGVTAENRALDCQSLPGL